MKKLLVSLFALAFSSAALAQAWPSKDAKITPN